MMSLLIVDDDPLLRTALQFVFQQDYAVQVADSAEAALACFAADCPDAVLLDLILPGMSGMQLLQQISQEYPRIPVIVISGAAINSDAVTAFQNGAADFVRKPFDVQELRLRVARALKWYAMANFREEPSW